MGIRWSALQGWVTCFDQDPQSLQLSLCFHLNKKSAVLRSFPLVYHADSSWGCWSTLSSSCQKVKPMPEREAVMFHTKPTFFQPFHFVWKLFLSSKEKIVWIVCFCWQSWQLLPSDEAQCCFSASFKLWNELREKLPKPLQNKAPIHEGTSCVFAYSKISVFQ